MSLKMNIYNLVISFSRYHQSAFYKPFPLLRYLTLKQMLPQLEHFESDFEDELAWLEEALTALETYKNINTLEEVERELGRYTVSVFT